MEEEQATAARVLDVLQSHGAVSPCKDHGHIWTQTDEPGAVEDAQKELAKKFGRKNAKALVQEALAGVGSNCYACSTDD